MQPDSNLSLACKSDKKQGKFPKNGENQSRSVVKTSNTSMRLSAFSILKEQAKSRGRSRQRAGEEQAKSRDWMGRA
jgi:hypothetical protein